MVEILIFWLLGLSEKKTKKRRSEWDLAEERGAGRVTLVDLLLLLSFLLFLGFEDPGVSGGIRLLGSDQGALVRKGTKPAEKLPVQLPEEKQTNMGDQ